MQGGHALGWEYIRSTSVFGACAQNPASLQLKIHPIPMLLLRTIRLPSSAPHGQANPNCNFFMPGEVWFSPTPSPVGPPRKRLAQLVHQLMTANTFNH